MSVAATTCQKFYGVKAKYHFLKFVRNPQDTPSSFEMTEAFRRAAPTAVIDRLLKPLFDTPELDAAYREQYWPSVPSFRELENYPTESFGFAAVQFFQKWNLDFDLFPAPKFESRQAYVTSRIYQAHDFWHVLTGYDTSLENEMALQAFGVGQYKQPISLAIIAGGLMHLIQEAPDKSTEFLTLVTEGFERGKQAKNLLVAPVLERLKDPLAQVRSDLHIAERVFT